MKRRREHREEGPIPCKRLRTNDGQGATPPLVPAQPETSETTVSFSMKRRREHREEGPIPCKRRRTSDGQGATPPLVPAQPETSETTVSFSMKRRREHREEGPIPCKRQRLVSTGQQPYYRISSTTKTHLSTYSTGQPDGWFDMNG